MLKNVQGSKSSKFTEGYEAQIRRQSTFAALFLAKCYIEKWDEVCIVNEGPYTTDPYRILGKYMVIELKKGADRDDYQQAIQEGRRAGCLIFIITTQIQQWTNEKRKVFSGQNEELDDRGVEAAIDKVKLLITIRSESGYMLIEIGESKF